MWQYSNPVNIIFTDRFINELQKIVNKDKQVMLFCENRFITTKEYKQIKMKFPETILYNEIENNPSIISCNNAITFGESINPDIIIAIGGGSVIDTAKVVRLALSTGSSSVFAMLDRELHYNNKTEFIAIPTTHGTASELTKWATVWDKQNKNKYSLSMDKNYADHAIYDYHFVESLPQDISLITTLDALSHSFEALWNKNSNPISDDYAIKAIKLIVENIGKLNDNTNVATRIALLKATMYSGLAFSNTKTAAAHSISYPLTSMYGIPHGIACSITLPHLLKIVKDKINSKIDQLIYISKLTSYERLENILYSITQNKLSKFGVQMTDLEELAGRSFTKGRMDNFIINLNIKDVLKILKENF